MRAAVSRSDGSPVSATRAAAARTADRLAEIGDRGRAAGEAERDAVAQAELALQRGLRIGFAGKLDRQRVDMRDDALDLVTVEHTMDLAGAIDRQMGQQARGIRLERVLKDLPSGAGDGRERERSILDQRGGEISGAVERVMRRREPRTCKLDRDDGVHRGLAGMKRLRPRSERHRQAAALRRGEAQRVARRVVIETEQRTAGGGCREASDDRGRVQAALEERRAESGAESRAHLKTGHERAERGVRSGCRGRARGSPPRWAR